MFLFVLLTSAEKCSSVPVIPNESIIEGTVLEYAILLSQLIYVEPEMTLYRLTIYIEASENIDNKRNLIKEKEKQMLQFYSKIKLSPELFNKRVRAIVKYSGDERGGKFWIKDIYIIN